MGRKIKYDDDDDEEYTSDSEDDALHTSSIHSDNRMTASLTSTAHSVVNTHRGGRLKRSYIRYVCIHVYVM